MWEERKDGNKINMGKIGKLQNWIDYLPRDERVEASEMEYRYSYSLAVSPVKMMKEQMHDY